MGRVFLILLSLSEDLGFAKVFLPAFPMVLADDDEPHNAASKNSSGLIGKLPILTRVSIYSRE